MKYIKSNKSLLALLLVLSLVSLGFGPCSGNAVQSKLAIVARESDRIVDYSDVALSGVKSLYESQVISRGVAKFTLEGIDLVNQANGKINVKVKEWIKNKTNPNPTQVDDIRQLLAALETGLNTFEREILPKLNNEKVKSIAMTFLITTRASITTAKTYLSLTGK